MIVSEIMNRDVVFVSPDTQLEEAARLMADLNLSGLPVVGKDGSVAGIITEGDLLRRAEIGTEGKAPGWFEVFFLPGTSAFNYVLTHARKIGMLMSSDVISVAPDAPIADAAKLMRMHGIKRLPVIDKGRLVGILGRADLVKVLADALTPRTPFTDAEIRARLSSEMAKQRWIPRAQIDIKVENGMVELCGTIFDPRERDALRALADTAGAKSVHDSLVCIEPISGTVLD